MDEWALNATRKNRASKETTLKSAEFKSWFDNDVFDLVDIRKLKLKNFVIGLWVLTVRPGLLGHHLVGIQTNHALP